MSKLFLSLMLGALFSSLICLSASSKESQTNIKTIENLPAMSQDIEQLERVKIKKGINYYKVRFQSLIAHLVHADLNRGNWNLIPLVSDKRRKTSQFLEQENCLVAINAGYFNMTDGYSASFVTRSGKELANPKLNKALVGNERLKLYLGKIFNRHELRVYKDQRGRIIPRIMPHNSEFKAKMQLQSSIQAGPQLLPEITSKEGAFLRSSKGGKVVDSIGTKLKAARSAIGILEDNSVILVCIEGARTKEFAKGANLSQLRDLLKKLGCVSALNFDGGTSTSLVVKASPSAFNLAGKKPQDKQLGYTVLFANKPERKVTSVLGIVPN